MSKLLLLFVTLITLNTSAWALIPSSNVHEQSTTGQSTFVLGSNAYQRSMLEFYANLSLKEYETLKGKKLNFFERLAFKTSQHRLRYLLKKEYSEVNTLSKISWFVKGLLLGPIALLIGYLLFKDEERELIKWIWFGTIGFVLIWTLAIIVYLQEK